MQEFELQFCELILPGNGGRVFSFAVFGVCVLYKMKLLILTTIKTLVHIASKFLFYCKRIQQHMQA